MAKEPAAKSAEDKEFKFTGGSLPDWATELELVDSGNTVLVPMIDYPEEGQQMRSQPWTTKAAGLGDTIKFVGAKKGRPAHFEVAEGDEEEVAKLRAAASEKLMPKSTSEPVATPGAGPIPPEPVVNQSAAAKR